LLQTWHQLDFSSAPSPNSCPSCAFVLRKTAGCVVVALVAVVVVAAAAAVVAHVAAAAVVVADVAANSHHLSLQGALQPERGDVQDLELILEICHDALLLVDVQEFQAAAKAKIRQLNLMVMEVYDEGRVLACFGSCPATSYSKLVLDWLGLNLTADQPVVALDGFVQTQRLQQLIA
jgi:hypothetical protein